MNLSDFKTSFYSRINQYYTEQVIYPLYDDKTQINLALGVIDNPALKITVANFIASKIADQGILWDKINALEDTSILDSFDRTASWSDMQTYVSSVFSGLTDEMKQACAWALSCGYRS